MKSSKKKGKEQPNKAIFDDLNTVRTESPEEMMKKWGGLTRGSTVHLNPLTHHELMTGGLQFSVPQMHGSSITGTLPSHVVGTTLESGHPRESSGSASSEHHLGQHEGLGSEDSGTPNWEEMAQREEAKAAILQQFGQTAEAAEDWQKAANDFKHANDLQNAAHSFHYAGKDFTEVGNMDGAAQAYSQAGSCYAALNEHLRAGEAYRHAAEAYVAMNEGSSATQVWASAGDQFNEAAQATSNQIEICAAYKFAGTAFQNAGEVNNAEAAFNNAGNAYMKLAGESQFPLQKGPLYMEAAQFFQSAGRQNEEANAYEQAGIIFNAQGNPEATVAFNNALNIYLGEASLDHKNKDYANAANAYANAANVYNAEGNLQYGDACTHLAHAQTDLQNDNLSAAAASYDKAASSYEVYGQANSSQPALEIAAHLYEETASMYQQCSPPDLDGRANAIFNAANCYQGAGESIKAQNAFEIAAPLLLQAAQTQTAGDRANDLNNAWQAYQNIAPQEDAPNYEGFWKGVANDFLRADTYFANNGEMTLAAQANQLHLDALGYITQS